MVHDGSIWSFHVVVLQKTAKKCTKNYNARTKPLFSSLNLLFSVVPVSVAVEIVVFLYSSLLTKHGKSYACMDAYIGAPIERFLVYFRGYFGKDAIVKLMKKLSLSSHVFPTPPFPRVKAPPLRGTGDSGDENFLAQMKKR